MTIAEAVIEALKISGKPLTYKEVYKVIIDNKLYVFGAQNPQSLLNSKIRKHCVGLNFPSASPVKHFKIISKNGRVIKYALKDFEANFVSEVPTKEVQLKDQLPEEKIQDAYQEHRENIKQHLIEEILQSDPAFFERLVIDVLLAMGYGGDFPEAGLVTGRGADEGIDGIIKEDKLGLDKIYIQAKRYKDKSVGRPEVQQFVGAMESVQKGVFITTTTFTKQATDWAERQSKNIVLINGSMLCELMLNHLVGIQPVKTYTTFKVDTDYFKDN